MCFLAAGLLSSAQAQVTDADFAWKIDYSTRFPEAPVDAGFTVYLTPNDVKFQIHGETDRYFLANKKDSVEYIVNKHYKKAGISEEDELLLNSLHIEFKSDTQKMMGYEVKKAEITYPGKSGHVMVWYTKALPRAYWMGTPYLKNIPGCVLKIVAGEVGNEKDTVQAQSIEKVKVAEDFFKIPKGYKIKR